MAVSVSPPITAESVTCTGVTDGPSMCRFPVLLRALLGHHPLPAGPRVPQAAGEGGRRPAARCALPLVLDAASEPPRPEGAPDGRPVGSTSF